MPIGLGCAALTWALYSRRETVVKRVPIDAIGLALLVLWVGSLQVLLDTGKQEDWFESNTIVALGLVSLVGFVAFLVWELTHEHPIVDLKLFANRNFSFGVVAMAGGFALFSGNVVLLPLWLQQAMGYTATWAGLVLAPVGVVAVLISPLAGRGIERGLARSIAILSFFAFAWSFWLRSLFTTQADYLTVIQPMLWQGVAGSLFFIALSAISMSEIRPNQMAQAAGLSNFVRISAGAFGTSITSTFWDSRTREHRVHLVEDASRTGWSFDSAFYEPLRSAGMTLEQLRAYLERLIDQQAMTLAANEVFLISAVLYLLLIVPVMLTRPARGRRAGPAPAASAAPVQIGSQAALKA